MGRRRINTQGKPSLLRRLRRLVIGGARNPSERGVFHKLSLIAFLAWVGLGADGLSSSCYGPAEAFVELRDYTYLGLFVALGTAITVFVISAGYSQIIELFPAGGGGYLVASKLLSPTMGMVSGCALLIDYVLTISVSVASGTDALFSFLPPGWHSQKLVFASAGVATLTLMNMRGVKESIVPLVPIFLIFVLTHVFAILYAAFTHLPNLAHITSQTASQVRQAHSELGLAGMLILLVRAYSMGAGTYTGIEAVSNGLPMLREPRVQTGKRTMAYMAISLAFTAMGLMIAYTLFQVSAPADKSKTLNAVLFESMTSQWGVPGTAFVLVTLVSEAAILFVAAQTGFLGGPRVIANMALDRWFPTRFAMLSDRLVTQNGVLLMGGTALLTMLLTRGDVRLLVVLYSINVFITFVLSQLGMVRHWWNNRHTAGRWRHGLVINGLGLGLTFTILVCVVVVKFHQGGWATLLVTGGLVALALLIKRHYNYTALLLRRLDNLVLATELPKPQAATPQTSPASPAQAETDSQGRAAVLLVNGFNGLGLHALFSVIRLFGNVFDKFVFVGVGVMDAGNFKGAEEVDHLREHIGKEVNRYVEFMRRQGYYAEGFSTVGTDTVTELDRLAPQIIERFPRAVFFGGQLVFPEETFFVRLLHNYIVFAVQRRFYLEGIPFVILPVRVTAEAPKEPGKKQRSP